MEREPDGDVAWRGATWRGAEESALAAGAAMTLPERLSWLEQAARSARRLGQRSRAAPTRCAEIAELPIPENPS